MRKHGALALLVSILMLLALVLPVAACTTPAPTTPATKPATTTPAGTSAATPTAVTPKTGGILHYPINGSPAGYDVHLKPSYAPYITTPIFSQLLRFDPDRRDLAPGNIIGDLAETWNVSTDGKTITFNLRKNVKWHDGVAFTADDVVYSLQKLADPKRSLMASNIPAFSSAEAVDANTVKVTLKQASAGFLMQLCTVYAPIQSQHLAAADPKTTAFLVGTGPFMIKDVTSGVGANLVKNPNYFLAGKPYLDGLSIYVMTDRAATMTAFVGGRIDMVTPTGGIFALENLQQVQKGAPNAIIEKGAPPQVTFLWLNLKNQYLKDVRVRQALGMLMDQKSFAMAGYGSDQFTVPDRAIFSTTYGLTNAQIHTLCGWDGTWDARVAAAKKLMADAGYASGFKIVILVQNVPEYVKCYQYLSDIWKTNLNIESEIRVKDAAAANADKIAGNFDIWQQEMLAATGDPDDVVAYFKTGGTSNPIGYSNPEVDKLFIQQTSVLDINQRKQMTQQIETLILKDMPVVPARGSMTFVAFAPYVKGFVTPNAGYGGQLQFDRVWLNK